MAKKNQTVPTSKISRTAITGLTAAKVGVNHLSYMSKNLLVKRDRKEDNKIKHEKKVGKMLFSALSQLRGTALKVSQMLSMENGLFPKAVCDELAKACHHVLPLNRALIRKVFLKEFGKGPEKLYKKFNTKAFAAASLGQVHDATSLEDEKYAVKVQYPGIAYSIKSDIKLIKTLIPAVYLASTSLPKKDLMQRVIDEIEKKLNDEVDYYFEAKQTKWFYQNINIENIKVPEVIDELSTQRVLTLKKFSGLHLDEWLKTRPSEKERNHFSQLIFDLFLKTTFGLYKINADPHPGNLLFMKNGCLGVLDFGCTKKFDRKYIYNVINLLKALIKDRKLNNIENIFLAYKELSMFSDKVKIDDMEKIITPIIKPFQEWLIEPFLSERFDFSKKSPIPPFNLSESKELNQFFTGFHRDQIYFNRSYYGTMFILSKIGGTVNTTNNYIL